MVSALDLGKLVRGHPVNENATKTTCALAFFSYSISIQGRYQNRKGEAKFKGTDALKASQKLG